MAMTSLRLPGAGVESAVWGTIFQEGCFAQLVLIQGKN